jgi:hypothetical protein
MTMFEPAATPAESDLLCESCGYILNGLPAESNCPECGVPIGPSVDPDHRSPAPVDIEWNSRAFWQTTRQILFQKKRFFRTTKSRSRTSGMFRFGRKHRFVASALFALAAMGHVQFLLSVIPVPIDRQALLILLMPAFCLILFGITWLTLELTTMAAIWLASKESLYWGMRLPQAVVTRAMQFHAANYLPVSIVAGLITWGYQFLLAIEATTLLTATWYLGVLSSAVVVCAIWLFVGFVQAMRQIRFANF